MYIKPEEGDIRTYRGYGEVFYENKWQRIKPDCERLLKKYARYFELTMDGVKPEEASKQCKLTNP